MSIIENYYKKANNLIERLNDTDEEIPERLEAKDIDPIYTAKAMLSTYIDRCVEEGTKELGSDYGFDDIEGGYETVQNEIERIAKQLKNYLKKGVQ